MTPSLVYRLLDSPLVDSFDLSSLEAIVSGGALLNSVALNRIKARLNVKQVYQGYGMTELAVSGIQCRPNSVNKIGSCGYLLPAMKCKVDIVYNYNGNIGLPLIFNNYYQMLFIISAVEKQRFT